MLGMVLEGGTFRPIFSSGVMDALVDYGVEVPYMIGVSAGITDGFSYVSKQVRRNYDILINHRFDKKYIGKRNFLTDHSLFGIEYVYETIPNELYPFDWDTFYKSKTEIRVGVTNAQTGKSEYLDGKELDKQCTMLKATCAIPFVFPSIEINHNDYYDGGLCDPIPVKKALEDGCNKLLIVLTRPKEYHKELSTSNKVAAKFLKNKYPNLVDPLLQRHILYNETVKYCEELEKEGKALILRPTQEVQIESLEKDMDKIKAVYHFGYNLAVKHMSEIKSML